VRSGPLSFYFRLAPPNPQQTKWSPSARLLVTTVYWPLAHREGIGDFGSPQRAQGPGRCPHPLPAIGTIFVAVDEPTVAMRHISKDVLLHRSN
jgi:hypothetical protein